MTLPEKSGVPGFESLLQRLPPPSAHCRVIAGVSAGRVLPPSGARQVFAPVDLAARQAVGRRKDCNMPRGTSPKREREYKELEQRFEEEGRYRGREKQVAARIVNKQRARFGETKKAKKR
jgi:hypothetical protein